MYNKNFNNYNCFYPNCKKYSKKNNMLDSLYCVENFLRCSQRAGDLYKFCCLINTFFNKF